MCEAPVEPAEPEGEEEELKEEDRCVEDAETVEPKPSDGPVDIE